MRDKKKLLEMHHQLKEHLFRQTGDKTYLKDYLLEYRNLMNAFEGIISMLHCYSMKLYSKRNKDKNTLEIGEE